MVKIQTKDCPFCGSVKVLEVEADALAKYRSGELLIQQAFPNLSAEDRERFISGICPTCWDNMFGEEM